MPKKHLANVMPFGDHLEELRRRLVFSLVGLAPILAVSLIFGQSLLRFLIAPLEAMLIRAGEPPTLQAVSPVETFGAYLKISMVLTVLVGVPWVLWQLWLFVAPGLYEHERRFARFLLPLSTLLTAVGSVFLYTVMLPVTLYFLIQFGSSIAPDTIPQAPLPPGVTLPAIPLLQADPIDAPVGSAWILERTHQLRVKTGADKVYTASLTTGGLIAQQYRIADYTDMVFAMGVAFAIAFQTPVAILLLSWTGLVDMRALAKHRKHVLFGAVIVAAILTPTGDPITLSVFALPLYALFELGLVLARLAPAGRVSRGILRAAPATPRPRTDGDAEA